MISSKYHKSRKAAVVAALAAGCVGVTLPMHGATVTATCSADQSANSAPGQYGTITASGDTSAQCEFFLPQGQVRIAL